MMARKNLRLLAYVRVSDVRGREGPGFISPDEQAAKCRAYAEAYGHQVIEQGEELDRSGGDMSRPVLEDFLQKIDSGEADGIIVAKLDRFARSNKGAWDALARIQAAGGELISVDPNIDTSTATGRLVRDILLVTANWERERIGEQWQVAQSRAVSRGIHVSTHTPPGYMRLPRSSDSALDRRLVPDEKYGPVVAEAFAMAARAESYSSIAEYLTAQGLPSGGKKITWEANRIKRLLANRVYLGEARYGSIVNAAAHEPLVSELTWNIAQRTPIGPTLSNQKTRLLAGICRCASCSYAMRSQAPRDSAIGTYRCRTTSPSGRCEHPATIGLQRLEDYVLQQFLARASSVTLQQSDEQDDASEAALVAVEAERSYREALTNMELRRTLGANDHSKLLTALKDEWQQALAAVPAPTRSSRKSEVDIAQLVEELQRRGDVQSLRELLASEIQAVFVRPAASRARNLPIENRVRIVWADEPQLHLPKRGELFAPRPYTWGADAAQGDT
jgi:DNA invertase Pin-like site-specific DNA recombinase